MHYVESLQPPDVHHVVAPLRHDAHDLHGSLGVGTQQRWLSTSREKLQCQPRPHLRAQVLPLQPSGGWAEGPGGGETHPARDRLLGRPPRWGVGVSTSSSDVSRLAFLEYLRKSCKGNGED